MDRADLLKDIWARFTQLKAWQRIAILIGIFVIAVSSTVSESETNNKSAKPSATPTAETSPTEQASPTASPSESTSPSTSPTPETPLEFRFAALRDLADLRKDIKEARTGISENGLGKFYWNLVEIRFNLSQLEMLLPRDEYAEKWNTKLAILKKAIEAINTDDENLTISQAKRQLDAILQAIPALEQIAKSLAN